MEDLMKALARAKPPVPEADRERMERDLAQILALPRERAPRWRGLRKLAPLLVMGAVIVLVVVLLPSPPEPARPEPAQPVQPAKPRWWHLMSANWSLMVVGDPARPYAALFTSTNERWVSADTQITVVQQAHAGPSVLGDGYDGWTAAGKPATAPQVGGSRSVRFGPVQPMLQKTAVSGFQMSAHADVRFESLDSLPADPVKLKSALGKFVRNDTYRIAMLAMEMMVSNIRPDQRSAAFEMIASLDGARRLGEVEFEQDRWGVGVAIPAPPSFQFTGLEVQLLINKSTGLPVYKREVVTTPQYGFSPGDPISVEQYMLLEEVRFEPILPKDVPVNGPMDSPIIER
ncbi:hypothetical protein SAMN05216553_12735 [Lentzea fradiae]|uniref:Uncharacterized protein n=1 Tax=Lentzea fradiae TaxID=200378 RepID=A0A1G8DB04_9PSEU|nr:hypothetical protein [Lentzea fradiae]SDH54867.1 hypothetical protein SAMN05216553_12735 [Lentzea fradiae]